MAGRTHLLGRPRGRSTCRPLLGGLSASRSAPGGSRPSFEEVEQLLRTAGQRAHQVGQQQAGSRCGERCARHTCSPRVKRPSITARTKTSEASTVSSRTIGPSWAHAGGAADERNSGQQRRAHCRASWPARSVWQRAAHAHLPIICRGEGFLLYPRGNASRRGVRRSKGSFPNGKLRQRALPATLKLMPFWHGLLQLADWQAALASSSLISGRS